MAFNLNLTLKKKESKEGKSGVGNKLVDDVRIFVALILVVSIILIVFTVFGVKSINSTMEEIDKQKTEYRDNQVAIANLKALQSKSAEYEAKSEEYNKLIPNTSLDQQNIMIEMENRCDDMSCTLTDIQFAEASSSGNVSQMAVTLSISGSFSDIMKLCQSIVTDEEFMRIDVINMTSTASSSSSSSSTANKTSASGIKTAQITVVKFAKAS